MTGDFLALPGRTGEGKEPTSIRAGRVIAPVLISAFLFLPGATSTAYAISDTTFVSAVQSTGIGGFAPDTRLSATQGATSATAEAVKRLHDRSGLTWDELARAFGVSRRTVHAWASGTRLNQAHAARLSVLARVVDGLAADNPEEARAALHAPAADGQSPYQRLIRSLAQPGNRREGFAPWELLAAEGEHGGDRPAN
jgi:DNA-binding transcriptional regulator YiaG